MARQTFEIRADELGEALTAQLADKPVPSERIRVTVETVPDYSDIPADILESQRKGLQSRLKSNDRATDEEVDGLFRKWT